MVPDLAAVPLAAPGAFPPLARGQLHEVHCDAADWASALGFALAMAGAGHPGPLVLVRGPGRGALPLQPCGAGLALLGIDPARLLILTVDTAREALRSALEAARGTMLAGVVVEARGALPAYDLTVSRRLVLAAERSGVGLAVLRGDAPPRPSAAHTRWQVRAAPSTALAARAPGPPALLAELLRRRGGPAGLVWRLEWNDKDGTFQPCGEPASPTSAPARTPPSGAVVSLAARRTGAERSRAA